MKLKIFGALTITFLGIGAEAWAIVGAPLTPVSVAGVARRTSRRTTARMMSTTSATAMPPGAVATLPAGCVKTMIGTVAYQNCSGQYYQPTYSGPNLVYVPTPTPTG